jgi:uncharacterized protein YodC (DUF2158 family)
MSSTPKRGDVVRLKSGGPAMTVLGEARSANVLICQWFPFIDGTYPDVKQGTFGVDSLKIVSEDQETMPLSAGQNDLGSNHY